MSSEAWKKFVADLYHCCEAWGEKVTEEDMSINIASWKEEFDDCPKHIPVKACTRYWNELCELYPN